MNVLTVWQWNLIPWYVFAAYWAISSLRVKQAKTSETGANSLATIAPMVLAYFLLFSDRLRIGPLRMRFLPAQLWLDWLGVAVTFLGVAIAIWARYCLGQYWSARVTLKQDHQLISSGPYAYVRHPIYAGMLLAVTGTVVTVGEWRGILALVIMFVAHSRKAAREEALLTREFGAAYTEYRRRTGVLFPRLSRAS